MKMKPYTSLIVTYFLLSTLLKIVATFVNIELRWSFGQSECKSVNDFRMKRVEHKSEWDLV